MQTPAPVVALNHIAYPSEVAALNESDWCVRQARALSAGVVKKNAQRVRLPWPWIFDVIVEGDSGLVGRPLQRLRGKRLARRRKLRSVLFAPENPRVCRPRCSLVQPTFEKAGSSFSTRICGFKVSEHHRSIAWRGNAATEP